MGRAKPEFRTEYLAASAAFVIAVTEQLVTAAEDVEIVRSENGPWPSVRLPFVPMANADDRRKRIVFSFARAAVLEAHGQADAHGAFLSPHANLGLTDEEFAEIAEQASERAAEIVAAKLDVIREIARHLERTNGVAGGASLSLLLRANEGNRDAALILLNFAPRVGADVDHLWRQSRRGGESFDTWYERNHRDLMVICSPRQAN